MKRFPRFFVLALGAIALFSACSKTSTTEGVAASGAPLGGKTTYPLTIANFALHEDGTQWVAQEQVFPAAPQRIVANVQGAAELLIRLGLGDRIVGVAGVFSDPAPDVKEAFAKIPVLSQDYAGREAILAANPDFVVGRGDLFADADWGSGTVGFLNKSGIRTYLLTSGKAQAQFSDLLADIDDLGRIFDVQDKAVALHKHYEDQIAQLKADPRWQGAPKVLGEVLSVEKGKYAISSGKGEFLQNAALGLVGLNNVFQNAPGAEVSNESFLEANPDVLLVFAYRGGPDPQGVVDQLYQIKELAGVKAVQNRKILIADFNAFYGGSGGIFDEMARLGELAWK